MPDRLRPDSATVRDTLRLLRSNSRDAVARATGIRLGVRIASLRTGHTRIPLTFTITHEDIR